MEDNIIGTYRHENPKFLVGGVSSGRAFANAGGNNEAEIRKELNMIAGATGGVVPDLDKADIYVKLENGVVAPRTGFDITIPEGEGDEDQG